MSDPFRTPPGTNPPRHVRQDNSYTPWIGTAIALAIVFALGFWATSRTTTTANPPAVTATPAPAPGAPAPKTSKRSGVEEESRGRSPLAIGAFAALKLIEETPGTARRSEG